MKKVFLGGTCNGSTWRDKLIKNLDPLYVTYYNPVVDDWTPECQKEEIRQRKICDYCLYVITPKMTGAYSIAEAVDDSNKRPDKTIFCLLEEDDGKKIVKGQIKSLRAVAKLIGDNGGVVFNDLYAIPDWLCVQAKYF